MRKVNKLDNAISRKKLRFENKFALQFHKFFHQSKMLQIHIQKVNEKPAVWCIEREADPFQTFHNFFCNSIQLDHTVKIILDSHCIKLYIGLKVMD